MRRYYITGIQRLQQCEIEQLLRPLGQVRRLTIMRDAQNEPRGFGFVEGALGRAPFSIPHQFGRLEVKDAIPRGAAQAPGAPAAQGGQCAQAAAPAPTAPPPAGNLCVVTDEVFAPLVYQRRRVAAGAFTAMLRAVPIRADQVERSESTDGEAPGPQL